MVAIDRLPGIQVSIIIDQKQLDEYDDDEESYETKDSCRSICKYVQSIIDKEYTVCIRVDDRYKFDSPSIGIEVSIDGIVMDRKLLSDSELRHDLRRAGKSEIIFDGAFRENCDRATIRKFRFSGIEQTSDDNRLVDLKSDERRMKKVGEIVVKLFRMLESRGSGSTSSRESLNSLDPIINIHEKALKGQAKSHSTSLGFGKIVKAEVVEVTYLDGTLRLLAPILRMMNDVDSTIEALKQLLILPRTPSPEPRPASRNKLKAFSIDRLDTPQKKRLDRFLQELISENSESNILDRPIKRERDDQEEKYQSYKKSRKSQEKVSIDLTQD